MVTTEAPDILRTHPSVRVYQKLSWGDEWTEVDNADSVVLTESIGTSIGRASFTIRNGKLFYPGDADFALKNTDVQGLLGGYVKIEATMELKEGQQQGTTRVWHGIITDARQVPLGDQPGQGGGDDVATEDWFVVAHDFKWLLGRVQLTKSKVVENGAVVEIDRALTFNSPWSRDFDSHNTLGNMDAGPIVFAEQMVTSSTWSATNIIDYLLEHYQPQPGVINWSRPGPVADPLLWFEPMIPQQGRTLFDVINDCIPRQRGLAWYLKIDEAANAIEIETVSYVGTQIDLPGGGVIPENTNKITVEVFEQSHIQAITRTISEQRRYQQVRVYGERQGVVATFRANTEMEKAWKAVDETAYASAASGDPAYGSKTVAEKAQLNDSRRMADPLSKVYTQFVLKDGWDGTASGTDVTGGVPYWKNGIRFEGQLPLLSNYDYSDPVNPSLNGDIEGSRLKPIVFCSLDPITRFEHVDRLSSCSLLEYYGRGITWSCHVQMMQNIPGIELRPNAAPHVLGDNHFVPATAEPTEFEPVIDWTTVEATVYFRRDAWCEGFYPATPDVARHDQQDVLHINIGSRAKKDWVAANTVVEIRNGNKITASQSGFIRDDTEFCEQLARAAWIVFGESRQSVEITLNRITDEIEVGQLATHWVRFGAAEELNSLVTSVSWDYNRGTTRITTEFAELNISAIAATA